MPARAEVALAEADAGAARAACAKLEHLAETFDSRLLRAEALVLRGRIALADSARAVFEAIGAKDDLAGLRGDRRARTPLSEREIDVVPKVAAGLSNRAVAHQLHISGKTVASHLSHILAKLDVANRAAVTAYYYEELAGNR